MKGKNHPLQIQNQNQKHKFENNLKFTRNLRDIPRGQLDGGNEYFPESFAKVSVESSSKNRFVLRFLLFSNVTDKLQDWANAVAVKRTQFHELLKMTSSDNAQFKSLDATGRSIFCDGNSLEALLIARKTFIHITIDITNSILSILFFNVFASSLSALLVDVKDNRVNTLTMCGYLSRTTRTASIRELHRVQVHNFLSIRDLFSASKPSSLHLFNEDAKKVNSSLNSPKKFSFSTTELTALLITRFKLWLLQWTKGTGAVTILSINLCTPA